MSDINDPAGVKALLDRLRTSQTWQSLVSAQAQEQAAPPPAPSDTETSATSSVAALLSQLNSASARPVEDPRRVRLPPSPSKEPEAPPPPPPPAPYAITEDVRSLTFQQALPRLAQLSDDLAVVSTIAKLKQEQDKVERELWEERNTIRAKYEEKVKVAKTRATLIGSALSKHEAELLTQGYEKEVKRFDMERVLPAWDGLVTSQQAALAQLRIPTMFPTAMKSDRERQQRVIQVLEGIVGPAAGGD